MGIRGELVTNASFVANVYDISEEDRLRMATEAKSIAFSSSSNNREKIAALKLLDKMVERNQENLRNAIHDTNAIIQLADRLGIREEVEGIAKISADTNIEVRYPDE